MKKSKQKSKQKEGVAGYFLGAFIAFVSVVIMNTILFLVMFLASDSSVLSGSSTLFHSLMCAVGAVLLLILALVGWEILRINKHLGIGYSVAAIIMATVAVVSLAGSFLSNSFQLF